MSELKWIAESGSQPEVPQPILTKRKTSERIAWILAVLSLAAISGLLLQRFLARQQSMPVIRSSYSSSKRLGFL